MDPEGDEAMSTSLANHFLIAMPSMKDPNFDRSVIYLCEHHVQGSVGLIVNQPMEFSLQLVFDQLKITSKFPEKNQSPLLFGGPNQPERGFVVHRPMGKWRSSLFLRDDVTVTTSNDIIRAMANNKGPKDALVTLGFAGWNSEQLEKEVMDNSWLVCPFNEVLLYDVPFAERWEYAGKLLGININELSPYTGHA